MAAFMAMGCATQQAAQKPWESYQAQDLNGLLQSGEYEQKVDSFLVIMDASGTMREGYGGQMKLDIAKGVVWALDQTIPDLTLSAGLRTLGQNFSSDSRLIYGMTSYSKGAVGGAAVGVSGGGLTPLGFAIGEGTGDLQAAQGNMAVIVVSDGKETDMISVSAAEGMKSLYGDRVCIYPVLVGDDADGRSLMEKIAQAGQCGFLADASDLASGEGMADFVTKVFLAKAPPPPAPEPPPPPPPEPPEEPMDSDGDGVMDDRDECPNTPRGATVDERGCWVYEAVVLFDLDSAEIRSEALPMLDEAVSILNQNLAIGVEIQGHTCSRGTDEYNMELSERRANAVRDYFVNQGIDADRLTAEGYGESEPAYSNDTEESRAKNRRVELKPTR
jgi:OOP family OmpA-OmpF porin